MQVRLAPVSEKSGQLGFLAVTPKLEGPTPFAKARSPPWPQLFLPDPETPPPPNWAPPTRSRPRCPRRDPPRTQSRKRYSTQTHTVRLRMPSRIGLPRSNHPSLTYQPDHRTKAAAATSRVCACAGGRSTTSPRGRRAHFRCFLARPVSARSRACWAPSPSSDMRTPPALVLPPSFKTLPCRIPSSDGRINGTSAVGWDCACAGWC